MKKKLIISLIALMLLACSLSAPFTIAAPTSTPDEIFGQATWQAVLTEQTLLDKIMTGTPTVTPIASTPTVTSTPRKATATATQMIDPNGCNDPGLSPEERANCGLHTYHSTGRVTFESNITCGWDQCSGSSCDLGVKNIRMDFFTNNLLLNNPWNKTGYNTYSLQYGSEDHYQILYTNGGFILYHTATKRDTGSVCKWEINYRLVR